LAAGIVKQTWLPDSTVASLEGFHDTASCFVWACAASNVVLLVGKQKTAYFEQQNQPVG